MHAPKLFRCRSALVLNIFILREQSVETVTPQGLQIVCVWGYQFNLLWSEKWFLYREILSQQNFADAADLVSKIQIQQNIKQIKPINGPSSPSGS